MKKLITVILLLCIFCVIHAQECPALNNFNPTRKEKVIWTPGLSFGVKAIGIGLLTYGTIEYNKCVENPAYKPIIKPEIYQYSGIAIFSISVSFDIIKIIND